jgi:hypothetical protein
MRPISVSLLFVLLAGAASASDGVLEINQSCAVNTGCFSGDTAGFPVAITTVGSYRLTGSLTVPNENTDGIVISANSVSIDLNGFEIVGPTSCVGSPVSCTPSTGTGTGIDSGVFAGISVKNGRVRGMGFRGVDLGEYSLVEDVQVSSTRGQQILVGDSSIVRDNVASFGGNIGVFTGAGTIVSGNSVSNHGSAGISTGSGSTITGNTAYLNGADGIITSTGSTVAGNLSYRNSGDGIQTTSSSLVQRNTIRSNIGFGLRNVVSLAPTAYRNNSILLNSGGPVDNSVDLGGNTCSTVAACP